ncbi:MAG: CCA tRNA nucleotidyltransferase [Bdellovibrionota bacterium]
MLKENMLKENVLKQKLTKLVKEHTLLLEIIVKLKDFSEIYLVGGVIRDIALKNKVKDIDLCTSLNIKEVSRILEKTLKVIDTGKRHGTISVYLENQKVEITEFRGKENTLLEDLRLRDFSINAIAFDVINNEIIDPFFGLNALKNNVLECPCDAKKIFLDDPLRILRMFRFSYAQNREPAKNLIDAAKENFESIKGVSIERIKDELSNILISENPKNAFKKLVEFNFLNELFPELTPMVNCKQNKYHIENVFDHTLNVVNNTPPILEVRLAALLHDTGKPHTVSIDEQGERHFYGHEKVSTKIAKIFLERLCFPKKTIDTVLTVVNLHMRSLDAGDAGIRRLIRDLKGNFNSWLMLIKADKPPTMDNKKFNERLDNFLLRYNAEIEAQKNRDFFKLAISGNDIMDVLALPRSKKIGEIKNKLLELIIEDPSKNEKEFLIKYLKNLEKN